MPYVSMNSRRKKRKKVFFSFFILFILILLFLVLLILKIKSEKEKKNSPQIKTIEQAIKPSKQKYDLDKILSNQNYELLYQYSEEQLTKKWQDFYWLHLHGIAAYHLAAPHLTGEKLNPDLGNQYLDITIKELSQSRVLANKENRFLIEMFLGKAYYAKGQFYMDCAIHHFQNALNIISTGKSKLKENQVHKNQTNIYYYLASAYSEMGDFDRSIHYFSLLDGEAQNLLYIAVSYYKQTNYTKAYEYLEQIINSTSDKNLKISCLNWKAKIYFEEGKYESAIALYEALIKDYPYSPDPLYRIGLIYYEMNNKVKARSFFRKATEKEIPCPQANEALLTLF